MKKWPAKNLCKLSLVICVITLAWSACFTTDRVRAGENQPPLFALPGVSCKCGESRAYFGLGYKVVVYTKFETIDGFVYKRGIERVEIGSYALKVHRSQKAGMSVAKTAAPAFLSL